MDQWQSTISGAWMDIAFPTAEEPTLYIGDCVPGEYSLADMIALRDALTRSIDGVSGA